MKLTMKSSFIELYFIFEFSKQNKQKIKNDEFKLYSN
jgi:hypothetical protein